MSNKFEKRLAELGMTLPEPAVPVASYVGYKIIGNLVYISGQLPIQPDGQKVVGRLGEDMDVEAGARAAKLCMLQCLGQLAKACNGDLGRVVQCVEVMGVVRCTPEFSQHPAVINGASDLLLSIFEQEGLHTRLAMGTNALPFDVAVEVKAIFEIKKNVI